MTGCGPPELIARSTAPSKRSKNSTPYQRNPYTPWAQGKDTAAWSAVRALTDPAAQGGDYYSPTGRLRGLPVKIAPLARTSTPPADIAASVWNQLEELAGVRIPLGVASGF